MATKAQHWAARYVGKPWVSGGRGPDSFDCWGLLHWVQRAEFGRELPSYPIPPAQKLRVTATMERAAASGEWELLSVPREGCAVGMSHHRKFHHVGCYTEADGGLVVHALEGKGVLAQPLARLRQDAWNRVEFFWHTSWTPTPR